MISTMATTRKSKTNGNKKDDILNFDFILKLFIKVIVLFDYIICLHLLREHITFRYYFQSEFFNIIPAVE